MLIHLCYILLALRRWLVNAAEMVVGVDADKYPCSDCSRFSSLLEGLQSGFLSNENTTITLMDLETHLKSDVFVKYLGGTSNRSFYYSSQSGANFKRIYLRGNIKNGFNLSKIIFYDEYFSLNFANIELHLENVHFSFSKQNDSYFGCLFCLNENEEGNSLSILIMDNVAFECLKGTFIYLAPKDFSLIDAKGFNFEIKLDKIKMNIENIAYFQYFLKISGDITKPGTSLRRNVLVRNFSFSGKQSLSMIRNYLENLNVSFESCYISNALALSTEVISVNLVFTNSSFEISRSSFAPILIEEMDDFQFLKIERSHINLKNIDFQGHSNISYRNFVFMSSDQSNVTLINLIIKDIKITKVEKYKLGKLLIPKSNKLFLKN
jgi:hypothetical protein